jgi:hypothetical protein
MGAPDDSENRECSEPKKPYSKPKLCVYGSLLEITRHVGNHSITLDPPPHSGGNLATR